MEIVRKRLGELLNIRTTLHNLFDKDLPINISWGLSKLIGQIENEYDDFETNRIKILKLFLEPGEEKVPEDKEDEFKNKLEELLDVEVELKYSKVSVQKLMEMEEPIKISPIAMNEIKFLFDE
jgi:hypothetical protein